MNPSSKRKWWMGPTVSIVALLVFLSFCEGAYRIYHRIRYEKAAPELTFLETEKGAEGFYRYWVTGVRVKPNVKGIIRNNKVSHRDIPIRTNSFGFRGPDLGPRSSNEVRVLVLGDSVTMGDYVNEDETYVSYMEQYLNLNVSGNTRFVAMNAGIAGTDIRNHYGVMSDVGLQSDPNIVIVGIFLNDTSPQWMMRMPPFPLNRSKLLVKLYQKYIVAYEKWFPSRSVESQEYSQFIQEFLQERGYTEAPENGADSEILKWSLEWGFSWSRFAWYRVEEVVRDMQRLVENGDIQLMLALFPVHFQVADVVVDTYPQKKFMEMAGKLGIPAFDMLPAMKAAYLKHEKDLAKLYYDYCHMTPLGNREAGLALSDFVLDSIKAKTQE